MKLLHVCESLPGGPAAYLQEIVSDQIERFGRDNVVLLVPAEQVGYLETLAPAPGRGPVVETFRRTGRNPASLLRLALAIRRAVRGHRPDIVHLHSTFSGALGRLALWRDRGPRIVYCAHCWSFARSDAGLVSRAYAALERLLLRRTDLVVDISPHEPVLRGWWGLKPRRAALVVSGIAHRPAARPLVPHPAEPFSLLYIGRTDRQKGFDLLIDEVSRIDPRRVTLTVVGANVVSDVSAELPAHVRSLGWVDRARVPGLIADADLVVMPSRWEGMPLLALEVLRAGRPLLASRAEPFGVIVEDGVNGILMDIARPGFLDRALRRLEAMDLAAMSLAARATFERQFRAERMNGELADAYLGLLAAPAHDPVTQAGADLAAGLGPVFHGGEGVLPAAERAAGEAVLR